MTEKIEHRCRDCGYFLFEASRETAGTLRTVCRRCRRVQTVHLDAQKTESRALTIVAA